MTVTAAWQRVSIMRNNMYTTTRLVFSTLCAAFIVWCATACESNGSLRFSELPVFNV